MGRYLLDRLPVPERISTVDHVGQGVIVLVWSHNAHGKALCEGVGHRDHMA